MVQSGSSLSGQWSLNFANGAYNNSGSLGGTVTGESLSVLLTPSVPTTCQSRVTATHTSPSIRPMFIEGTYAAINCSVPSR